MSFSQLHTQVDQKEANINNNVDDTESIASDESEETIDEIDENEWDRIRASRVTDMKELEFQFSKLKEMYINERQMLIDQKLKEIEEETAEEFTLQLQKLKQNMDIKIQLATLMRDFRLQNIEHTYKYEEMSVTKSLENDKVLLYDKHEFKLENELKQLEESRRQFLLDYNLFQLNHNCFNDFEENSVSNSNRMSTSSNFNNSNNYPASAVILPGAPFVVYSLQDCEVLEDLSYLKKMDNLNKL